MSQYEHKTWNHLVLDKVRETQVDVELLKSYLAREEEGRQGGAGLRENIGRLDLVSGILFDEVYKPLREKWD